MKKQLHFFVVCTLFVQCILAQTITVKNSGEFPITVSGTAKIISKGRHRAGAGKQTRFSRIDFSEEIAPNIEKVIDIGTHGLVDGYLTITYKHRYDHLNRPIYKLNQEIIGINSPSTYLEINTIPLIKVLLGVQSLLVKQSRVNSDGKRLLERSRVFTPNLQHLISPFAKQPDQLKFELIDKPESSEE